MYWRQLTAEEEKSFREWARENHKPGSMEIDPTWHPVIREECAKMDAESALETPERREATQRAIRDILLRANDY